MSRIGTARGADLARFRALAHDLAWQASGQGDWPAAIGYLTQARDMLPAGHAARAGRTARPAPAAHPPPPP